MLDKVRGMSAERDELPSCETLEVLISICIITVLSNSSRYM